MTSSYSLWFVVRTWKSDIGRESRAGHLYGFQVSIFRGGVYEKRDTQCCGFETAEEFQSFYHHTIFLHSTASSRKARGVISLKETVIRRIRQIAKEIEETVRTEEREVRNVTERLDAEKNEAIFSMNSAKSEVEGLKSWLEAFNKEFADAKKEFEKMKASGKQPHRYPVWTELPARNDALPSTINAEDLAANGSPFVHAGAAPGRTSAPTPVPTRRRHGLSRAAEMKATRCVSGGPRDRGRYRRGVQLSQQGTSRSLAGPARITFGGSPARIRPDRWDPAIYTMKRENGQFLPTRSSDRLPSESTRDPLGSGGVPLRAPRKLGKRGANFASGGGLVKRPRVGNSSSMKP